MFAVSITNFRSRFNLRFLGILLFLLPLRIFASDLSITQTLFLPSIFYVGDQVELRISLRTPFADTLTVPQELPQPSWGRIDSVRILRAADDPEIRIRFTSFVPGTRTLPTLDLGSVQLEGVNIFVSSLLEDGITELAPPRDAILLPGTALLLFFQVLLLIMLPLGIWLLLRQGRPLFLKLWSRYRDGLPFRRSSRSLKLLASNMETMDARSFYIRILEETRLYLSDRLKIPALSATTSELNETLKQRIHSVEVVATIMDLFRHGDRVKFAKEPSSLESRMLELHNLEACLRHIEQEEKLKHRALENMPENGV